VTLLTASMTKLKLPIHPRPVSPLNAEPLRPSPADIFLDDSSDQDSNDEQCVSKRRRIEKLGERYLRGGGLFIMTASLEGPLTGWVNPWAKRHRQRVTRRTKTPKADIGKDILETAVRVPVKSKAVIPARSTDYDVKGGPSRQEEIDRGPSHGNFKWLKRTQDHTQSTSNTTFDSPTPARGRNKLRPLDDVVTEKRLQGLTSKAQATPAEARISIAILEQPTQGEGLGPPPTLSAGNKEGSRARFNSSKRPQPSNLCFPTTLSTVILPRMLPEPRLEDRCDARTSDPATLDSVLNDDLKLKTKSVDVVPASDLLPIADPLKSLAKIQGERNHSCTSQDANPAQNFDFASSGGIQNVRSQTVTSVTACSEGMLAICTTEQPNGSILKVISKPPTPENQSERVNIPPKKMPQPSPSTQTSNTTNTHATPSAQVIPALLPHSAESYPSITSNMIETQVTPADNKIDTHQSPSAESALPTPTVPHETCTTVTAISTTPDINWADPKFANGVQFPRSREGILPFSAFKSPPACTDVTELDTQQMLSAISPLGFSTTKTITLKPREAQAPGMVRRSKLAKEKKRASFATRPTGDVISSRFTQGSIKGILKVSKMVSGEPKADKSLERLSQPRLFSKPGLDMETSEDEDEDEEKGHTREDDSQLGVSSLLRGESRKELGSLISGRITTGSSITSIGSAPQQDAQQQVGRYQKGDQSIEEQDDFNLASTMDDLGSFLGTWDADKEAKDFGNVTSRGFVKLALKSKSSSASTRR
jgi:hypothetical protein